MKKRSFFERLSGSITTDDFDGYDDDLQSAQPVRKFPDAAPQGQAEASYSALAQLEDDSEGQLPVDVYQTTNEIVIRTFIAGVRPDEIGLSISRDMVIIEGAREERANVSDEDYATRELFWGKFSRTVFLSEEVDVDSCTAASKDGLLTITLPKLDKTRQTKLKVKAG